MTDLRLYLFGAEGGDLQPMWEAICRDLGINPRLTCVHFLFKHEARNDYGLSSWGGVLHCADELPEVLPEVLVVFPYTVGNNGFHFDWVELRNTCYHELIHILLLGDAIEEEEVDKMADMLNRRQDGWHYWRIYLRGRAIALGLGPLDPAGMSLWQYARLQRKVSWQRFSQPVCERCG